MPRLPQTYPNPTRQRGMILRAGDRRLLSHSHEARPISNQKIRLRRTKTRPSSSAPFPTPCRVWAKRTMAPHRGSMWPSAKLVAKELATAIDSTWWRAPPARGIACPRNAATWSSASRMVLRRAKKSRGASPTVVADLVWWSIAIPREFVPNPISTASGSVSSLAAWRFPVKGTPRSSSKSGEELLDKFVENKLDAAFIDDDFAVWYLHNHSTLPLVRVAEYVPGG